MAPLFLLLLAVGLLYLPLTWTVLAPELASYLQTKIGAPVRLDRMVLRFPAELELEGLLLMDPHQDTLLYAGELRSSIGLIPLIQGRIAIGPTELTGIRAHLIQAADSSFNFDHIVAAFATTDTSVPATDDAEPMPVSIARLEMHDVHYDMELHPSDLKLDAHLGAFVLPFDEVDLTRMRIHAGGIQLEDTRVELAMAPGPEEPDTYPDLGNSMAGIDVSVRELHLHNLAFRMVSSTTGDSMAFELGTGAVVVDSMSLPHQRARLRSIVLDQGSLMLLSHGSSEPPDSARNPPPWLEQHDGFRYWVRDRDLQVGDLSITNATFAMHSGSMARSNDPFDPAHLHFEGITVQAGDIVLGDRILAANIAGVSANAADSTRLKAGMKIHATPEEIEVDTAFMAVEDASVELKLRAMIGEPSKVYTDPVHIPVQARIKADIDRNTLERALHRFGGGISAAGGSNERWKGVCALNGSANDIDAVSLQFTGDMGTVIRVEGSAQELMAWPSTRFHVDVKEITMGAGMHEMLASRVPPDISLPSRFTIQARLDGGGRSMEAQLDMESDQGDVAGTCSVAGPLSGMPDAMKIDLDLDHLALARFTGDTSLSNLSAHIRADGSGLNTAGRSGSLDFVASQLRYHGQDLEGSQVSAQLHGDSIHFRVNTHADAMDMRALGDAYWRSGSDTVTSTLDVQVTRLGLQEFGWYGHPLNIHGQWTGAAAFSTGGYLALDVSGDSVSLSNCDHVFAFERFAANMRIAQDSTFIHLDSDALGIVFGTNVPVDSLLPRASELGLSFFVTDAEHAHVPGERMDLRMDLPRTDWLTEVVLPELEAIEMKELTGTYDGDADELQVRLDLPVLKIGELDLRALAFTAEAHGNALDGELHLDSAHYGAFRIRDLMLSATSAPGALRTDLSIGASDRDPEFLVPLEFQRSGQEIALHVREGLELDTVAWTPDPQNELRFSEGGISAEHFTLTAGAQTVALNTNGTTSLTLEHFDIGALVNMVSTTDSTALVEGELSGKVDLPVTTDGNLEADLRMEHLMITGYPLGDLAVDADGSSSAGYEGSAHFVNGTNAMDARVHYRQQGAHPEVLVHADVHLQDLSFLSPFVAPWIYKLDGGLGGTIDWTSIQGKQDAKADVNFTNTVIGAVITGAQYELKNERVRADPTGVVFDRFTVLDSLGTAFILDGHLRREADAQLGFDLRLRTDSFRLMHRVRSGNSAFYGDLFTSTDVRITGTSKAPVVKGDLGVLPGTDLSVVMPGSKVELVRSEGIVEFTMDLEGLDSAHIVTNEERMRDSLRAQLPEVDMDLRLHIAPQAAFAVVLDPTAGDQATFKGTGDLHFRYTPDGDMDLRGPFTVSEGGYTLAFYGLVKKRFDLIPGSHVTWQGDPMAAKMDIRARYVSQSSAYPLVAKSNATMSDAQRNRLATLLPFEVIIHIGGAMHEPDIDFAIDLPREYRNSYQSVDAELDRLADKSHEEERNKQVFGLLVFNSFIQDEGSGTTSGSELATSAARNSVNGILTDQLNKATGQLVKGVDVQLGVSTVDQTENSTTYQRTSLDYKVTKRFMNDRLSFQVGGSVGVDEKAASAQEVNDTRHAQYSILYSLTRDGRYQVRGFYENAFDLYDGEITDSGVAIMLTREFEENEKARQAMREAERQRQALERKSNVERERQDQEREPGSPDKR